VSERPAEAWNAIIPAAANPNASFEASVTASGRICTKSGLRSGSSPKKLTAQTVARLASMTWTGRSRTYELRIAPNTADRPTPSVAARRRAPGRPREQRLKQPSPEDNEIETTRRPPGGRHAPEHLGDGLATQLHRSIGHDDVVHGTGVPNVETGVDRLLACRQLDHLLQHRLDGPAIDHGPE